MEQESRMTDYETRYKNLVALIQRELDIYEVLEGKVQEQVCILRDFHRNVRRIIKGEQHEQIISNT